MSHRWNGGTSPRDLWLLCRLWEELVVRLPFSEALLVELERVLADSTSFSWLCRELVVDDLPLTVLHSACMNLVQEL